MNRIVTALRDERGVALVMAMVMLVAMTGLMLAFLSVSAFEPQISQNLATTAQARFVADAGLEWAFNQLATIPPATLAANSCASIMSTLCDLPKVQKAYWDALLATPGKIDGVVTPGVISGVTEMQIPGPAAPMSAAFGTFVVRVRNDNLGGDNLLTGCPNNARLACNGNALDPGGAASDTNSVVVVVARGTVRGIRKTVTAAVLRPPALNFDFNGAVSFPGTQADAGFSGDNFQISGKDWKMPAAGVTPAVPDGVNPAVWGIAVSNAYPAHETDVEAQVSGAQADNITGKQENVAQVGQGANTINTDPGATMNAVHDFIKAVGKLPPSADVFQYSSSMSNPLSLSDQTWGSPTNPVIVHVKGTEPDPTSKFTALTLSGNTVGYGILIVEDGDFKINGNFRWNGPVIVSGGYVGIGFMGGGDQQVYGAVISNETAPDEAPGFKEGLFAGNAKIRYSKEALSFAINGFFNKRSAVEIFSWREQ